MRPPCQRPDNGLPGSSVTSRAAHFSCVAWHARGFTALHQSQGQSRDPSIRRAPALSGADAGQRAGAPRPRSSDQYFGQTRSSTRLRLPGPQRTIRIQVPPSRSRPLRARMSERGTRALAGAHPRILQKSIILYANHPAFQQTTSSVASSRRAPGPTEGCGRASFFLHGIYATTTMFSATRSCTGSSTTSR